MNSRCLQCFITTGLISGYAWVAMLSSALGNERVALHVLEPQQRQQTVKRFPVAVGIVFPEAEAPREAKGSLFDDLGREQPVEIEPTGWWDPERTRIKWLLLRFRADADRKYEFEPRGRSSVAGGAVLATLNDGQIDVHTGPLRVRLSVDTPSLFANASLNDHAMLSPLEVPHVLVADDGKGQFQTSLREWRWEIEDATATRAELRGRGTFVRPNGAPLASLDLRLQFFSGESFVRLYHTLTWLEKDVSLGVREWALRLKPALGRDAVVRIGESDYGDANSTFSSVGQVIAQQESADRFTIRNAGNAATEGARLGGWFAVEDKEERGVGIALRETWQMFPKSFAMRDGEMRLEFWPSAGPRMGFREEDIMPPDFFNNATYWNTFRWVKGVGHFVHEMANRPEHLHTAEGAARTHELTIHFYDKTSSRRMGEVNSLTQHPLIVRQAPESALRVPLLGFQFAPVQNGHPDFEESLDSIAKMALSRKAENHDYGLWRYGMVRWGGVGVTYRWMDGVQYDLQLIPWLQFMRGGDRTWFEEAEATARFAMDVATNHYNSRGIPTGYQSSAAGMPFPSYDSFASKIPKVHFLALCYHLTGSRRAKEVMDSVIKGNLQAVGASPAAKVRYQRSSGREIYNMNVFWPNAWFETFDPALKEHANEWREITLRREFSADMRTFNTPIVYLEPGLVMQHELSHDERLASVMLGYLDALGYPRLEDGGVYGMSAASLCPWAHRQTKNPAFAGIGWDLARILADASMCYPVSGNQIYGHWYLPLLANYSEGVRLGMKQSDPFTVRGTLFSLPPAGDGRVQTEICLRPKRDGDLPVRFIFSGKDESALTDMKAILVDEAGQEITSVVMPPLPRPAPVGNQNAAFYPSNYWTPHRGTLVIPEAKAGKTYRVRIEGSARNEPRVLPVADAHIVQKVHLDGTSQIELNGPNELLGTQVFTQSTTDSITVNAVAVRDALTGELLHRPAARNAAMTTLTVGKGRLLRITIAGRHWSVNSFKGVSPWFSRTRESWFKP